MRSLLVASLRCAGPTACGTDTSEPGPDAPGLARATWYQDVGPILSRRCMSCHQDGGIPAGRAGSGPDHGQMPRSR